MPIAAQAALLGVVQGLTEFLPVSSSAHLILVRAFLGWNADELGLAFDVACHLGTLIAVLVYFRRELVEMFLAVPRLARPASDARAKLVWLLAVGTLPAAVVGVAFGDYIENALRAPWVTAVTLTAGGLLLFWAERAGGHARAEESLTMGEAFAIGCAQAAALVPGVSRSGATITLALFLGLRRTEAARFIFLLAIPAILGAAGLEGLRVARAGVSGAELQLFAIGIASSAIVGYATVKYFIQYLARHSLDVFGWYRLALAAAVVVWVMR
jgi:undecaprenyl-diphosphatase